jgi:putative Holliday junction resolvase
MKFLGIDFGEKNIGLAIAEDFLVEPAGVVKSARAVQKICQEQTIEKIIIGISEGKMAKKTHNFGSQLASLTGLSIEYQDETLTSEEAKKLMVKIGKPKKKRQEQGDAVAAALILKAYLDQQKLVT